MRPDLRRWLPLAFVGGCVAVEGAAIGTRAAGEACEQAFQCRAGHACEEGTCVPLPEEPQSLRGRACDPGASDVCGPELACGPQGVCTTSPGLGEGERCVLGVDCLPGLLCKGTDARCAPPSQPLARGELDLGDPCDAYDDCRLPYVCALHLERPVCHKLPFIETPTCVRTEEEAGLFRVYYELPPQTPGDDLEFYRLPFPSDIRKTARGVSLAGHPTPGAVLGVDVAGETLRAVEDEGGFPLNPSVFFRLSDPPVISSLCVGPGERGPKVPARRQEEEGLAESAGTLCERGGEPTQFLVDIDPGSPGYGTRVPVEVTLRSDKGRYICQNALGMAPMPGHPLSPGTTYAAVVTTDLRDVRGDPPVQDRDFERVLEGDPTLPPAVLEATAPLRRWIAEQGIDPASLAAATVFTTADVRQPARRVHAEIQALPAPRFDDGAYACPAASEVGRSAALFCGDALAGARDAELLAARRCGEESDRYLEIHATYRAPVLQHGTRPYRSPSQGGAVEWDDAGRPVFASEPETMCLSITVPRAVPGPWPVVLYAHGLGGHYRALLADEGPGGRGLLEDLIDAGFAVVGFDGVLHGPRQDPSRDPADWPQSAASWRLRDPGRFVFNVAHPRASRDNVLQATADLHYLVRVLREAPLAALGAPALAFDPTRIAFLGQGQGASMAAAFLRHEEHLSGAALLNAVGDVPLSILGAKRPNALFMTASVYWMDYELTRVHPMMGLLSMLLGPADPLSYARDLVVPLERAPRSLLAVSSLGDRRAPEAAQRALIRALGLPLVGPALEPMEGTDVLESPVANNLEGATAGAAQFRSSGGALLEQARDTVGGFLTSEPHRIQR